MPAVFSFDDWILGGFTFAETRFRRQRAISELRAREPWRGGAVPILASLPRRCRPSGSIASSPQSPRRRI
jgi:hypothetical protein